MTSSVLNHNRLPMPIAEMGAWHFWAAPEAVGLSPEDAEAIRNGTATEQQQLRALQFGQAAMNALIMADGPECGRPS